MSINCGNKSTLGAHTHETKEQVRECYGLASSEATIASSSTVTELTATEARAHDKEPVTRTKADRPVRPSTFEPQTCTMKVKSITWKNVMREDESEYLRAQIELSFVNGERSHNVLCWINLTGGGLDIVSDVHCRFNGFELMDTDATIGDYRKFITSLRNKKVSAWVRPETNRPNLLGISFSTIRPAS